MDPWSQHWSTILCGTSKLASEPKCWWERRQGHPNGTLHISLNCIHKSFSLSPKKSIGLTRRANMSLSLADCSMYHWWNSYIFAESFRTNSDLTGGLPISKGHLGTIFSGAGSSTCPRTLASDIPVSSINVMTWICYSKGIAAIVWASLSACSSSWGTVRLEDDSPRFFFWSDLTTNARSSIVKSSLLLFSCQ